jgi:hypothetical protein
MASRQTIDRHRILTTLKRVTTPIISLKMLLAQWTSAPEITNYKITPESRIPKIIDDLTSSIENLGNVTLKNLHQLELLHMKLNAGHEQTWLKLRFTEYAEKSDDCMKWAEFGYFISHCEGRGMDWYRLERKSNNNVNYVVIDFTKKTVWFRRGMFGNAKTTNAEFSQAFGLNSILDIINNDQTLNNTSLNSTVLQNSNLNSINMSQAMANSTFQRNDTTTAAEKRMITNSVLGNSNEVSVKIKVNKHESITLEIRSLKGSLLEGITKSVGGDVSDINPNLLKKQGSRKRKDNSDKNPKKSKDGEIVLKESELLDVE